MPPDLGLHKGVTMLDEPQQLPQSRVGQGPQRGQQVKRPYTAVPPNLQQLPQAAGESPELSRRGHQVPEEEACNGAAGMEGEHLKGVQGGLPMGTQLLVERGG